MEEKRAFIHLKERAEKVLRQAGTGGEPSGSDLRRMNHELEVRQVELEIQNEELRQAQREIEQYRNQYHDLYHLAPIGFLSLSPDGLVALTNRLADEMFAGPGDTLLGTAFSRRVLSEDYSVYFSCLKKVDEFGGRQACEVRFAGKAEEVLYVRIEAQADKDEAGKLKQWRLVLSDITQQKGAEKALRKSEALRVANERTRTILESITDGFMALDKQWHITYFNETGARMLGMKRFELVGGYLWDLFPHATASNFYSEYHRALETSTPVHFEEFYPEPLNLWIECHCYPSPEGLSVYFRDITERKRIEGNQALLTDVLRVLNNGGELHAITAGILGLIREATGFSAVGLRLRQGEDFPYYEHKGFSSDFLMHENFLCTTTDGGICRDAQGRVVLECTCGLVLSGRTDDRMPFFTAGGSFWSNDATELLTLPVEADPRTRVRNFCIHEGYRSVGLFPVPAGKEIIGLLQFNDPRKGRFTPNLIAFFESLAQNIGLALQRTTAEEARRESGYRLEQAQRIAHLGSWELDLSRNELKWSDEVYRIFGLQPQEFGATYDAFLARIHPDDRAAVDAAYAGSLRDNLDAYETEHRIVRKSTGEIRFVHEKCDHFRDASGRIIRSVGMILDITERKQAEEKLRQLNESLEQRVQERTADLALSNRRLQQEIEQRSRAERFLQQERRKLKRILDSMHDGVYIVDREYGIQYINPAIEKQFGQVHGRKCHQFFHDLSEPCTWCNKDQLPDEGYVQWEFPSAKTNKIYDIWSTPYLSDDGTIATLNTLRDITWRKEVERILGESEARYRTLVETMGEGLVVADEKDVLTFVNPKFCTLLGYSCDAIIGRPASRWLDEPNLKILEEQLHRRRKGEQDTYEIAWTRCDGSPVHTLVSPRAMFNSAGDYTGSFAVMTDITERKRAEDALRTALSEIKRLKDRLEAENIYFQKEIKLKCNFDQIIGQSNALKYVLYRAEQVAPTDATVLILGETGTGKGVLAAAIHQMSPRRDRPLVIVNCAALPANLIESELFGRERGAFTGSDARQIGRFEIADGSTLCLDEISELPLAVQSKLLRVIQHNEFERLGSSRTIKVNTRIVATTNRNLEQEVRQGRFREDLFYRLNVFPLTVPPLRKRKEDIAALVQYLTERYGRKMGKRFSAVSRETMQELQDYDWPGNIRELENVIERAIILCPGPILCMTDHLESFAIVPTGVLKTMEEAEREQILNTLLQTHWRINGPNGAAAILDLPPSTLRSRMQKLGIRRPDLMSGIDSRHVAK
jgi:formate hydrogenlyase transcriptional activator